ncbi:MAG: lipoprotein-releasing system ATP-binding protein LolD [Gammaproteobacteria bacterium]|nr:lipoprotein-releasing system ATP-binding protein LolD [Gammaproteobacteria bacterium]MAY01677.1 lipoprotein-releasing system ATP-binding protein LolD [Gammaproteobacteria bacterium]|tara:strand:- start:26039 stop:26722 length:684 start_codon:yes stop_codon:yes gene_type:complete
MSESILQCHKLSKVFSQGGHELIVLNDLDFSLAPGESVAIIGASGSGKTTLLNLLGGLDKPSSGEVLIKGQNVQQLKSKQQDMLRNQTLGFVYQFHHLLGEFTAQENVAMPLIIAGKPFKQCMQEAEAILAEVGLEERLTHKPSQLSGGERQRVAIARALVHNPACVLMDEPTGNLDRNTAKNIQRLMLSLKEKITTSFVIVTHDQELARMMDRTLLLQDGRLVSEA